MPLVNVLINGRAYTVGCDEGEEQHLRELAQFLDVRVRELSGTVGHAGDARLLLMAGLLVSDELSEALARSEQSEKEIAALKARLSKGASSHEEDSIAEVLENAAARLEAIAEGLLRS